VEARQPAGGAEATWPQLKGVGLLVAVIALAGAGAVHHAHELGAVHHLQVRLGPRRERLVAVRRGRDVGLVQGGLLRRLLKRFSPRGWRGWGLVSSAVCYLGLGPGHAGLDDVSSS
jgi:hypothetical protein